MAGSVDVTRLLQRWSGGDREAFDELMPVVYDHLKRVAHARLRGERPGHTLNTTALVHEAYLKLIDIERVEWTDRNHFWSMAARAMRRILVDYARMRSAHKRGGSMQKASVDLDRLGSPAADPEQLLALDDALDRLDSEHPRSARAVELHYIVGLTQQEVGDILDISQPTVARDLRFARAYIAATGESFGGTPN